jgi:proline iminopeptidase
MPTFASYDGTELAYHLLGDGTSLVCLPGGPMLDASYLGDLGGLSERVQLVLVDHRGTGQSAVPADTASYRCDRLVEDVEALRVHLGLARMNLLGHSAGTNIAALYAARYPERLDRLILVTPSTLAVGISATAEARRDIVMLRAREPWFAPAAAAFERIIVGQPTDADWDAVAAFTYGRWDAETQAHYEHCEALRNEEAADIFRSDGAFDPEATQAALAGVGVPVLLLAGQVDVNSPPSVVAEYAELFPEAAMVTLPGCGHFPWLDAPEPLSAAIAAFLA